MSFTAQPIFPPLVRGGDMMKGELFILVYKTGYSSSFFIKACAGLKAFLNFLFTISILSRNFKKQITNYKCFYKVFCGIFFLFPSLEKRG
jgi:hypothetical protein